VGFCKRKKKKKIDLIKFVSGKNRISLMQWRTPENLLSDKNGQQITKEKIKIRGHSLHVKEETSKTSKIR